MTETYHTDLPAIGSSCDRPLVRAVPYPDVTPAYPETPAALATTAVARPNELTEPETVTAIDFDQHAEAVGQIDMPDASSGVTEAPSDDSVRKVYEESPKMTVSVEPRDEAVRSTDNEAATEHEPDIIPRPVTKAPANEMKSMTVTDRTVVGEPVSDEPPAVSPKVAKEAYSTTLQTLAEDAPAVAAEYEGLVRTGSDIINKYVPAGSYIPKIEESRMLVAGLASRMLAAERMSAGEVRSEELLEAVFLTNLHYMTCSPQGWDDWQSDIRAEYERIRDELFSDGRADPDLSARVQEVMDSSESIAEARRIMGIDDVSSQRPYGVIIICDQAAADTYISGSAVASAGAGFILARESLANNYLHPTAGFLRAMGEFYLTHEDAHLSVERRHIYPFRSYDAPGWTVGEILADSVARRTSPLAIDMCCYPDLEVFLARLDKIGVGKGFVDTLIGGNMADTMRYLARTVGLKTMFSIMTYSIKATLNPIEKHVNMHIGDVYQIADEAERFVTAEGRRG